MECFVSKNRLQNAIQFYVAPLEVGDTPTGLQGTADTVSAAQARRPSQSVATSAASRQTSVSTKTGPLYNSMT